MIVWNFQNNVNVTINLISFSITQPNCCAPSTMGVPCSTVHPAQAPNHQPKNMTAAFVLCSPNGGKTWGSPVFPQITVTHRLFSSAIYLKTAISSPQLGVSRVSNLGTGAKTRFQHHGRSWAFWSSSVGAAFSHVFRVHPFSVSCLPGLIGAFFVFPSLFRGGNDLVVVVPWRTTGILSSWKGRVELFRKFDTNFKNSNVVPSQTKSIKYYKFFCEIKIIFKKY